MEFWKGWVQSRKLGLLAFTVSFGIWPVFFAIYHFPMEALEYPCILQAAAGAAFFGMDAWKETGVKADPGADRGGNEPVSKGG